MCFCLRCILFQLSRNPLAWLTPHAPIPHCKSNSTMQQHYSFYYFTTSSWGMHHIELSVRAPPTPCLAVPFFFSNRTPHPFNLFWQAKNGCLVFLVFHSCDLFIHLTPLNPIPPVWLYSIYLNPYQNPGKNKKKLFFIVCPLWKQNLPIKWWTKPFFQLAWVYK